MIGDSVYLCWRAALKGEIYPADKHIPTGVGGVDGHPQPGLYKRRDGGGYENGVKQAYRWVPVKIYLLADASDPLSVAHTWAKNLTLKATVGKDQDVDPLRVWGWCQTRDKTGKLLTVNAVSQSDYKYWLEHDRWPDEVPGTAEDTRPEPTTDQGEATTSASLSGEAPAGIGHNSADDPEGFEALTRMLMQEQAAAEAWIAQGKEGKSAADFASNWKDKLVSLEKRVLAAFTAEKEPYLRKGREIDERWRSAKASAAFIKQRMDAAFNSIARKETARLQAIANEEARKRAEQLRADQEAEYKRLEAARKARHEASAATGELPLAPDAVDLPPPPTPPVVVPEQVRMTFGGASGKKAAPKEPPKVAVITDWRSAAMHYAQADSVKQAVQKLADADAKKGIACPGSEIGSKEQAA